MEALSSIDWQNVDWITPAIHGYALVVFVLTVTVYSVHQFRLADLARRVGTIGRHIEGHSVRSQGRLSVDLDHLGGIIVHLSELVRLRTNMDLLPVIDFLRAEERHRQRGVLSTLVNLTETMIDLFPILGILGTVWGISGVSKEDFSSDRLLFLFGTAVSTTLWALLYVLVFRIIYSAFVQTKVALLSEHVYAYRELLNVLAQRCSSSTPEVLGAILPVQKPSALKAGPG